MRIACWVRQVVPDGQHLRPTHTLRVIARRNECNDRSHHPRERQTGVFERSSPFDDDQRDTDRDHAAYEDWMNRRVVVATYRTEETVNTGLAVLLADRVAQPRDRDQHPHPEIVVRLRRRQVMTRVRTIRRTRTSENAVAEARHHPRLQSPTATARTRTEAPNMTPPPCQARSDVIGAP